MRETKGEIQAASVNLFGKNGSGLVEIVRKLEIYYDSPRTKFWARNDREGWIMVKDTDVKRILGEFGFRKAAKKDENVSQIDALLTAIQRSNDVDYAGSLAGYHRGVYEIGGNRVLVRDSPRIIEPAAGDWEMLETIIDRMFGPVQLRYLYGWIKIAFEALSSRNFRVGQALVLAGPKDCGKSLLQELITVMLGGRCAKPHRYMSGGSDFNGELFGAEHLMMEDEQASTDIRARRNFGARIKEVTANTVQSCHPKHRPAISLPPFWRLTISVNDEPENLMMLPPIDESLEDKLIILKAKKYPMPMPTVTDYQRELFMTALKAQIPHFLYHLRCWQIPEESVSQRYGIIHYHHPDILETLGSLAPEHKLLELIDTALFSSLAPGSFEGTAAELEHELTKDGSEVRRAASQLLSFQAACGTYLGRLAKAYPGRITEVRTKTGRIWTINPP
ncbi:MAG TPA: DUF5906 domain-containing protein [Chthoniobacterales bacterium]|nr:DUF5906 domain-containing protein [Chthoniobacterales bacterium]